MAYSSKAPYASGTVQDTQKDTIPAHQAYIIQRRKKTIPQDQHHIPRRATPGGPLGTLTKLGKNTAACLLLRYVTEGQKNKTLIYRTTHIITSKLHEEEMSIG